MDIKEKSDLYLCNTYARNLTLSEGMGSELWDTAGKHYVDFTSGIAVNIFGVSDTEWADTVSRQAYTLSHTSNLYYSEPAANLAEELCLRTGMKKVFLCNSGAEANECAIKSARKYSFDKYGAGRADIITLKNSFHGRTLATLTATGQIAMHEVFQPMVPGFSYVEPNDIEDFKKHLTKSTTAVMLELVQGEGGVVPLDKAYVQQVAALCAQQDVLLMVDEVQTGVGRSGTLYAFQQYNIVPDIVTSAKGLGGGLPIGAVMFSSKTKDVLTVGSHGSTFGANPIVAAGALSILKRIDEAFLQEVVLKSDRLKEALSTCGKVKSICGLGLMLGLEVEGDAKDYVQQAQQKGLLILTAKTKIRLLPALNIPEEILESGIVILKEILS